MFKQPALLLASLLISTSVFAKDEPVVAKVTLKPLGSFEAVTSAVIGKGKKTKDSFAAKEIKIPVATLKTGMSLRDNHMKDYLKAKDHKFIVAKNVKATKGAGTADFQVKGITKPVKFTYKELGPKSAQAHFKVSLKDYGITGINYNGVGVQDEVEITATIPYE